MLQSHAVSPKIKSGINRAGFRSSSKSVSAKHFQTR